MSAQSKQNEAKEILQGRVHLLISAVLFLLLGLIALMACVGAVIEQLEASAIASLAFQGLFLFVTSVLCFRSRNSKKYLKLVIACSIFYVLLVFVNYFNGSGIGIWRVLSLAIPINAVIGAYKNQVGIALKNR